MPIHDFHKLKEKLQSMGITIGQAGAWRSVGTIDVLPEDIGERIILNDEGIFYIDNNGVQRRGFMYKKEFYFEYDGRINFPKFHIFQCRAINDFGRSSYRFANSEPIKVIAMPNREEKEVDSLELCGYCRKLLSQSNTPYASNSTDFVDILRSSGEIEQTENTDVDIFGYVRNWEEISLAYRTSKEFTCERCGIKPIGIFEQRLFTNTHHKNGNKTDNRESNLECLCVKCHSEIDDAHKQNFSSRAQRVIINEFKEKYGKSKK